MCISQLNDVIIYIYIYIYIRCFLLLSEMVLLIQHIIQDHTLDRYIGKSHRGTGRVYNKEFATGIHYRNLCQYL